MTNIGEAVISNAYFDHNDQHNIKFAHGNLTVSNCNFTHGRFSHIDGEQA